LSREVSVKLSCTGQDSFKGKKRKSQLIVEDRQKAVWTDHERLTHRHHALLTRQRKNWNILTG